MKNRFLFFILAIGLVLTPGSLGLAQAATSFGVTVSAVDAIDALGNADESVRSFGLNFSGGKVSEYTISLYDNATDELWGSFEHKITGETPTNVYVSPAWMERALLPLTVYRYEVDAKSVGGESTLVEGRFTTADFLAVWVTSVDSIDATGNPAEDVRSFALQFSSEYSHYGLAIYDGTQLYTSFDQEITGDPPKAIYISPGAFDKVLEPNTEYCYVASTKSEKESYEYRDCFKTSDFEVAPPPFVIDVRSVDAIDALGNPAEDVRSFGLAFSEAYTVFGLSIYDSASGKLWDSMEQTVTDQAALSLYVSPGWMRHKLLPSTAYNYIVKALSVSGVTTTKEGRFMTAKFEVEETEGVAPVSSEPAEKEVDRSIIDEDRPLTPQTSKEDNKDEAGSEDISAVDQERDVVAEETALVTAPDEKLTERLSGRILLQTEGAGEAWYVDPSSDRKFYLRDGSTAYSALRTFGLGITNDDLSQIPVGIERRFEESDTDQDGLGDALERSLGTNPNNPDSDNDGFNDGVEVRNGYNPLGIGRPIVNNDLIARLQGNILLQVESVGEAWYVNPEDGMRYYMSDGDAAYQIMRFLSLGITNDDLRRINVGNL